MIPEKLWIHRVVGDPSVLGLPELVLNLILFLGICCGAFFLTSDLVLGLGAVQALFAAAMIAFFGLLFLVSRKLGVNRAVAHVTTVAAFAFCLVNFFIDGGIQGPTLIVVAVVLSLVTLIHPWKVSLGYFFLGALLTAGGTVAQFFHPQWVIPYASSEIAFWDIGTTFIFCLTITFFVMRMVSRFFSDILEQTKTAQETAMQADKMAALGTILANISHDISAPAGVIGSALGVTRSWWHVELPKAARILTGLDAVQTKAFWSFLETGSAAAAEAPPNSREARVLRERMEAELAAGGHPDPQGLAADLVDLPMGSWNREWQPLLGDEAGREALAFAIEGLIVDRSNRLAARAYDKLLKLVEALRSYSRSESHQEAAGPTSVAYGLDTVLTLYGSIHGAKVEVVRDFEEVPVIVARADELIQVWTNLVQNALQAMEQGGVLTVALRLKAPWVEVRIADTGPGIRREHRDRIFRTSFTTKRRGVGTGLGLGIVHRIVTDHGGRVVAADAEGGGAVFIVQLPITPSEQ
jgi:signal transduction histidine kinase